VDPLFFESAADFKAWLQANHDSVPVMEAGYFKKGSGRASMTYPESVDEALCFGWIDGVRHALDEASYTVRFTPRRPGSIWSALNVKRMQTLIEQRRVQPAGLAAFAARDPDKTNRYSFEQDGVRLDSELEAHFKAHAPAWAYFQAQPAGYRRVATWWVVSAKQPGTRERRLAVLIADSAAGRRIGITLPRRKP
jgi:uncharacterized protein YdeI (YjbR/CyaY-like superfamily)